MEDTNFLAVQYIVGSDIEIICLGFNAGNTTVLWATIKRT